MRTASKAPRMRASRHAWPKTCATPTGALVSSALRADAQLLVQSVAPADAVTKVASPCLLDLARQKFHWELDDRHGVALTLNGLANLACAQGDYAVAQSLHEQGLAINRGLGDRRSVAISLVNLGAVAEARGDRLAARALYQECLEIFRELNEKVGIASSLINLGVVAVALGEIPHAQGLYQESLAMLRELGDRRGIAFSLEGLADVGLASGCAGRAACIWGAAERLREEISSPLAPFERGRYLAQLAAARGALGDADFATAWEKGRAVTLEQAIDYAMSEDDARPRDHPTRPGARLVANHEKKHGWRGSTTSSR